MPFFEITGPPSDSEAYYDRGPPIFRGIYEDNDPKKRLMAIINYNTDISKHRRVRHRHQAGERIERRRESSASHHIIYGMTH